MFKERYTKALPSNAKIAIVDGRRYAEVSDGHGKATRLPLTADGKRVRFETERWWGSFQDVKGIRRKVKLGREKQASATALAALRAAIARARGGEAPPISEVPPLVRDAYAKALDDSGLRSPLARQGGRP